MPKFKVGDILLIIDDTWKWAIDEEYRLINKIDHQRYYGKILKGKFKKNVDFVMGINSLNSTSAIYLGNNLELIKLLYL